MALKVFLPERVEQESDPDQFRRRLLREAESAGILSHPNIVAVHDVAVGSASEPAYIAMEFVEGETLRERLWRVERLPFAEALDVLAQVAAALDHAHAQGVVHRDIKPANVLITPAGVVKITDFGVAHLSSSDLTEEGEVLGTPRYMAPEQVQGRPLDHRADVFALGVVGCEMLAGRSPAAGTHLAEVVHEVVQGNLDLSPGALSLPAPLCRVLARAMAVDPDRRYQGAGEFVADLRRADREARGRDTAATEVLAPVAGGGGLRSFLPPRWRAALGLSLSRLDRPRRRRLLGAAAIALLALLALAGWWASVDRPPALDPDDLARARLRYLELLREGHRLLREGEPLAALRRLERAELLAPGSGGARRLRQEVLETVREEEIAARLAEVRSALGRRRYEAAIGASEALLQLAPGEAATRALLEEIERSLSRGAPGGGAREAAEAAPAAEEGRPAPAWSVLQLELRSELPRGTLLIYAGERRLLGLDLGDVQALPAPTGEGALLAEAHLLPAGESLLRVYVAVPGQPARLATAAGALPPGAVRILRVEVSAAGEVSAALV